MSYHADSQLGLILPKTKNYWEDTFLFFPFKLVSSPIFSTFFLFFFCTSPVVVVDVVVAAVAADWVEVFFNNSVCNPSINLVKAALVVAEADKTVGASLIKKWLSWFSALEEEMILDLVARNNNGALYCHWEWLVVPRPPIVNIPTVK